MNNLKLNRAKELFQSLKEDVGEFLKSQPYYVSTKRGDDARLVYFLAEVKETPENIPILVGEVLQNLRSALDHKSCELFRKNSEGSERHIQFPIAIDESKYEANKERMTNGMPQAAKDYIDSIKPYKEGNFILWQMHELNNLDKHRTLVTSGSAFQSMDIGAHAMGVMMEGFGGVPKDFPKMPLFIKPADNLFPLSVGKELFITEPNGKETAGMRFVFQVAINESKIAEGEEVIGFLEKIVEEVEKHVNALEALSN